MLNDMSYSESISFKFFGIDVYPNMFNVLSDSCVKAALEFYDLYWYGSDYYLNNYTCF